MNSFRQSTHSFISRWYNKGLSFCSSRLKRAYESNGRQLTSEEKSQLRLLIRILDQTKMDVEPKIYLTIGQLMLHHTQEMQESNPKFNSMDGVFPLSGDRDPLLNVELADRFLKLGHGNEEEDKVCRYFHLCRLSLCVKLVGCSDRSSYLT